MTCSGSISQMKLEAVLPTLGAVPHIVTTLRQPNENYNSIPINWIETANMKIKEEPVAVSNNRASHLGISFAKIYVKETSGSDCILPENIESLSIDEAIKTESCFGNTKEQFYDDCTSITVNGIQMEIKEEVINDDNIQLSLKDSMVSNENEYNYSQMMAVNDSILPDINVPYLNSRGNEHVKPVLMSCADGSYVTNDFSLHDMNTFARNDLNVKHNINFQKEFWRKENEDAKPILITAVTGGSVANDQRLHTENSSIEKYSEAAASVSTHLPKISEIVDSTVFNKRIKKSADNGYLQQPQCSPSVRTERPPNAVIGDGNNSSLVSKTLCSNTGQDSNPLLIHSRKNDHTTKVLTSGVTESCAEISNKSVRSSADSLSIPEILCINSGQGDKSKTTERPENQPKIFSWNTSSGKNGISTLMNKKNSASLLKVSNLQNVKSKNHINTVTNNNNPLTTLLNSERNKAVAHGNGSSTNSMSLHTRSSKFGSLDANATLIKIPEIPDILEVLEVSTLNVRKKMLQLGKKNNGDLVSNDSVSHETSKEIIPITSVGAKSNLPKGSQVTCNKSLSRKVGRKGGKVSSDNSVLSRMEANKSTNSAAIGNTSLQKFRVLINGARSESSKRISLTDHKNGVRSSNQFAVPVTNTEIKSNSPSTEVTDAQKVFRMIRSYLRDKQSIETTPVNEKCNKPLLNDNVVPCKVIKTCSSTRVNKNKNLSQVNFLRTRTKLDKKTETVNCENDKHPLNDIRKVRENVEKHSNAAAKETINLADITQALHSSARIKESDRPTLRSDKDSSEIAVIFDASKRKHLNANMNSKCSLPKLLRAQFLRKFVAQKCSRANEFSPNVSILASKNTEKRLSAAVRKNTNSLRIAASFQSNSSNDKNDLGCKTPNMIKKKYVAHFQKNSSVLATSTSVKHSESLENANTDLQEKKCAPHVGASDQDISIFSVKRNGNTNGYNNISLLKHRVPEANTSDKQRSKENTDLPRQSRSNSLNTLNNQIKRFHHLNTTREAINEVIVETNSSKESNATGSNQKETPVNDCKVLKRLEGSAEFSNDPLTKDRFTDASALKETEPSGNTNFEKTSNLKRVTGEKVVNTNLQVKKCRTRDSSNETEVQMWDFKALMKLYNNIELPSEEWAVAVNKQGKFVQFMSVQNEDVLRHVKIYSDLSVQVLLDKFPIKVNGINFLKSESDVGKILKTVNGLRVEKKFLDTKRTAKEEKEGLLLSNDVSEISSKPFKNPIQVLNESLMADCVKTECNNSPKPSTTSDTSKLKKVTVTKMKEAKTP
ncbi:formin-J isoform X2 [Orussus abietinus]|uniref:formin-J isoform X2 n=1 Tax=Orussus abietinus TaxID=222816 RepID=UPI000626C87F|nr:formin-J isoform X2 [Orussus abietinus]